MEQDLDSSSRKVSLLNRSAPDFHLQTLDGRAVSLADFSKRKLVLVFWASWNNASHPEMLLMSMLYQNGNRADSSFDILGVSLDDNPSAARQFVSESKIPFPVAVDDGRTVAGAYDIRSVPTVLVVDTSGKVVYGGTGQRDTNTLAQILGVNPRELRMELGAPNAGRGN